MVAMVTWIPALNTCNCLVLFSDRDSGLFPVSTYLVSESTDLGDGAWRPLFQ